MSSICKRIVTILKKNLICVLDATKGFRWGKCGECLPRWHFICANRPDFELLDEQDRKKVAYICLLCGGFYDVNDCNMNVPEKSKICQ